MLVASPAGPMPTKLSAAAISPRSRRVKVKRQRDPGRITACDMQARQSAAGAATRCTPPSVLVNRKPVSQHPGSKVCSVCGGIGSGSDSSRWISTVNPRCFVVRACWRPRRTVFRASGFNPLLCMTSNPFGENITRATHRELKYATASSSRAKSRNFTLPIPSSVHTSQFSSVMNDVLRVFSSPAALASEERASEHGIDSRASLVSSTALSECNGVYVGASSRSKW
mmetsp:Transcript_37720/g.90580  ORF Transcript_37720/g.90580 Transcript_37720/m.90580 type:complete len:226 (-) Transcript_37720:224-901(-)